MLRRSIDRNHVLWRLSALALPVFAEHMLHVFVGVTDTWLANNLQDTRGLVGDAMATARATNDAAGAAVGSVSYILWFIGLFVGAVGSGATAIISRAVGGRHRRLANKACGQSVLAAAVLGTAVAVFLFAVAGPLTAVIGLHGEAGELFERYLRVLVIGVPFSVVMFTANACLRGSGDTVAPAAAMIVLDVVNVILSVGLTFGVFGLPRCGFMGIAYGTTLAYVAGGVLQLCVLVSGRRRLTLFVHRLRPDFVTLRRLLRIGLPSGAEGLLWWTANFVVIGVVNRIGNAEAAAHSLAIRVESFSFMSGLAIGTAVATLVGHSLGAGDVALARRVAYTGYAFGGGLMTVAGVLFIACPHAFAGLFTRDPLVRDLVAGCLFRTGFVQCGMAAAIVFGSALRGAGDTLAAMLASLGSVVVIRCIGVTVAGYVFHAGLWAVWVLLCVELMCRGALVFARFRTGRWAHARV